MEAARIVRPLNQAGREGGPGYSRLRLQRAAGTLARSEAEVLLDGTTQENRGR